MNGALNTLREYDFLEVCGALTILHVNIQNKTGGLCVCGC